MTDMHELVLPISLKRAAATAIRKLGRGDGAVAGYIPRAVPYGLRAALAPGPADGQVYELDGAAWPDLGGESPYALAPVLTDEHLRWLHAGPPTLGDVFSLAFRSDAAAVGAAACRVEPAALSRRAKIQHLQAREPSVETLR